MNNYVVQLSVDYLPPATVVAMLLVLTMFFVIYRLSRFSVWANIYELTHLAEGEYTTIHDRLVMMGSRALPALRAERQRLEDEYQCYCESLMKGSSLFPYANYVRAPIADRHYRHIIATRQGRVVDVINEIESRIEQ